MSKAPVVDGKVGKFYSTRAVQLLQHYQSEGIETIRTPYRSPKTNAYAERWVRTVREECLDCIIIMNEGHLKRVLLEYVGYYNRRRPHQGIGQQIPVPLHRELRYIEGCVQRREVLGGIIHDYYREEFQAA